MGDSKLFNIIKAKEDLLKSPEQLEKEKQEILAQRIPKLNLNGLYKNNLIELAYEYQGLLLQIFTSLYELNERQEKQKYSVMELNERARQIEKGKNKTRKSTIVHTGLGGSVFTKLAEEFPQAPPKISLFSRYERVVDRRSYKERREPFLKKKPDEYISKGIKAVVPKAKIRTVYDEDGTPIVLPKKKNANQLAAAPPVRLQEEEHQVEEHHEEEHEEEEQYEEENHEEETHKEEENQDEADDE